MCDESLSMGNCHGQIVNSVYKVLGNYGIACDIRKEFHFIHCKVLFSFCLHRITSLRSSELDYN